jgi:hypothetical protein
MSLFGGNAEPLQVEDDPKVASFDEEIRNEGRQLPREYQSSRGFRFDP